MERKPILMRTEGAEKKITEGLLIDISGFLRLLSAG